MQVVLAEKKAAPIEVEDADADESQATYHGFSHLIKPDMRAIRSGETHR
jgi:hypothetical protein